MDYPKGRKTTSWIHLYISPREPVKLSANTPVDEEVFSLLEYVSEIPSVGYKFLQKSNTPKPKKTLLLFQSYVRQAKTFYKTANQLHYRASALMYYYAFLNLAKAYIALSNPEIVSGYIGHGLSMGKFSGREFNSQTVLVQQRTGVFQLLYEKETRRKIPKGLRLNVSSLLGYCSDVKYEYETAGFGKHKVLPAKARFLSHSASKITWPTLAILDFSSLKKYRKSLFNFYRYFEQVLPDRQMVYEVFGINAASYSDFSFFQSHKTYAWVTLNGEEIIDNQIIRGDVLEACKGFYESPIYDNGYDLKFTLPLRVNNQIPMNQPVAIYILMFYIGSLVRYHPEYIENLLNSKDAWIIERFVRGSCVTFLRYIANVILDKDYMFSAR